MPSVSYKAFEKELCTSVLADLDRRHSTRFANLEMKIKIAVYYIGLLAAYLMMLTATSNISFIAWYLLAGTLTILGAINVAHDAAHRCLFRSKQLNDIIYFIAFQLSGYNPYAWRYNHVNGHHQSPNVQHQDPHFPETPLLRFAPWQPLKPYHRYQSSYAVVLYCIHSVYYFIVDEWKILLGKDNHVKLRPRELRIALMGKTIYFAFFVGLPLLINSINLKVILLALLCKHIIVSIIMVIIIGLNHFTEFSAVRSQDEEYNTQWSELQLSSTSDFAISNRWVYWILGGFNAHCMHHVLPQICHVHYPSIAPLYKALLLKYQIPYTEITFIEMVKSHFVYLKKMGRGNG